MGWPASSGSPGGRARRGSRRLPANCGRWGRVVRAAGAGESGGSAPGGPNTSEGCSGSAAWTAVRRCVCTTGATWKRGCGSGSHTSTRVPGVADRPAVHSMNGPGAALSSKDGTQRWGENGLTCFSGKRKPNRIFQQHERTLFTKSLKHRVCIDWSLILVTHIPSEVHSCTDTRSPFREEQCTGWHAEVTGLEATGVHIRKSHLCCFSQ